MYSARMKSIIEFVDVLTDLSNNDNYNISNSFGYHIDDAGAGGTRKSERRLVRDFTY